MNSEDELFPSRPTYSFQKIEGFIALPHADVILEDKIIAGDLVGIFTLPNGKYFLSKDPEGTSIEKITSAYIFFNSDITIEEK